MTNAEEIRNMSDEMLADFLSNIITTIVNGKPKIVIDAYGKPKYIDKNNEDIAEWLRKEKDEK